MRLLVRVIVGFAAVWLAVAQAMIAHASATDAIEITGLRTVEPETVRALIRATAKADSPGAADDAALKALMATGHFADVKLEWRQGQLFIAVVENPIIATVSIDGVKATEKKTIEAELKLKPRERYTKARANADAVRVREHYRRLGRLATTVTPAATTRADGRVDVAFAINEGAVNRIDRIQFTGNRVFTERQLKDVITTSQSGWLDILKSAAFYDPERIEADRDLLQRHYVNNGFPDAKVTGAEARLNAEGTSYIVTFVVDEGDRHVFGVARIDGSSAGVDGRTLQDAVKVKQGSGYSRESIDRSIETMQEKLTKDGRPFARITAEPKTDMASRRVDVVFRIEKGTPLYVERIDIVGNTRTKDHVIRRELKLAEGDGVSNFLIERARRRVMALGFFKTVEVKPEKGSASEKGQMKEQVRIVVAVVEQETGEFGFGGGYSQTEGLIGDISWTERNLLGNGQYLRFKVAGSATRLQADIGFTEPRFLGSNVSAGFDLVYKDVDYTKQASYNHTKAGGSVRLGFPLNDETSMGVNYTFTRNTLYSVGSNASAAIRETLAPGATSAAYNTSSIGYSIVNDTRDSKRKPSNGVYYSLAQDFAGAGGDVRYIKTVAEGRAYYTVADGVTLFGRTTGGVINGWGGQDVRLLDMFYKGSETVRGFATAGIGPRDTLSANRDALGGRMYLAATAETLFDIPGIPKDLGIRGAVFADAGSLWGTNKTAASLPGIAGGTPALRASAGVGLTWDSPIGPLRADYAFPLVKQPYDKLQPFSFGLSMF